VCVLCGSHVWPFGLYKILCVSFTSHFDRSRLYCYYKLLHKNIFCKYPLYCAIYCTIFYVPVIAPPRPISSCFSGVCVWGCLEVFFCYLFLVELVVGFWMGGGGGVCKKNRSRHGKRKRGHYCTLLCNTPLPAPRYCLQYCAIYFAHDPLYCDKILAISCKGQVALPSGGGSSVGPTLGSPVSPVLGSGTCYSKG